MNEKHKAQAYRKEVVKTFLDGNSTLREFLTDIQGSVGSDYESYMQMQLQEILDKTLDDMKINFESITWV